VRSPWCRLLQRLREISDIRHAWLAKIQLRDLKGLHFLQRAHDLNADNASISYHLAVVLDASGQRAEAKSLLQATLAKNPKFDGADEAKQVLARW